MLHPNGYPEAQSTGGARYLERAENTARPINSTPQTVLDLPRRASFGWDGLPRVAWHRLEAMSFEHMDQDPHDQIDYLQADLAALNEAIARQYFTPRQAAGTLPAEMASQ